MALKGLNISETRPYVSKKDPDKTNPTTFHIGLLDPFLRSNIEDQTIVFEKSSNRPEDPVNTTYRENKRNLLAIRFGVRNIENFVDPQTGQPIKFDTVSVSINGKNYIGVSDRVLMYFGKDLINELAEVILAEQDLTGQEQKN